MQTRTSQRSSLLLVSGCGLLSATVIGNYMPPLRLVSLALMLVVATLAVLAHSRASTLPRLPVSRRTAGVLATLVSVFSATVLVINLDIPTAAGVGLWAGLCALAVRAMLQLTSGKWPASLSAPVVLVVAHLLLLASMVLTTEWPVDVHAFLTQGSQALLQGRNPYALTFPNLYGQEQTELFYGPGVVVDGRITYGFPYPPATLLPATAAYLLGDVRLASVIALGAVALLIFASSRSTVDRLAAVLVVVSPGVVEVVRGAWIEATIAALLGLTVWAIRRQHLGTAAVLVGLLLSSKQYMVVALPCLWLLRAHATRGRVAAVVASAAAVNLPFLLAGPSDFWRSIVEFQLVQPFRPDSISLLVESVNRFGWPAPSIFAVLPLAAGLLTAVLCAWRMPLGPAAFATSLGLSLLVTVLLSKQAFLNYYFLVGQAWIIAAWAQAMASGPVPETAVAAARRPVPASSSHEGRSDRSPLTGDVCRPLG